MFSTTAASTAHAPLNMPMIAPRSRLLEKGHTQFPESACPELDGAYK